MINFFLTIIGKLLSSISSNLNLGSGSTWPGHIALTLNKNFIKEIIKANPQLKIILIAGTNGKTTTGKLLQTILEKNSQKVFQNKSGANLLNGIASTLIQHCNIVTKINYDFAIFEVDENTLPLALKEIVPNYLILLNLFRDQLDRYGEVNTITSKWQMALKKLTSETTLILNADDPQITFLGLSQGGISAPPLRWKDNTLFFGLKDKKIKTSIHQHASDSTYCPNCGKKLIYNAIYFSHLGNWECKKCEYKHPTKIFTDSPIYPLFGMYNEYNTNAAVLVTKRIGINDAKIKRALQEFKPAFGRQEILHMNGKIVQIFLSKNPTSFNESLRTIASMQAKTVLLVLNDRIPDGKDVSWIWDVDFEDYIGSFKNVFVSGGRAYDMGLRIKYAVQSSFGDRRIKVQSYSAKFKVFENLNEGIKKSLKITAKNETVYILPTYSAMLEVRKILMGRKIL